MVKVTRKFLRIIFSIIVIAVGPYILIYFLINERGKDFLVRIAKEKYNREIQLNSLTLSFPFTLSLSDLQVDEVKLSQLVADLGGYNPFTQTFTIKNLYLKGLVCTLDKRFFKERLVGYSSGRETSHSQEVSSQGLRDSLKIKINNIKLEKIEVCFRQEDLIPPLEIKISNLRGEIKNFSYPLKGKINVNLTTDIVLNGKRKNRALMASGWIDWPGKNMDLVVKADKLDYFMFKDYYPPFWKPDNLELKEALVSLNAHFLSKNDDMLIDYYIILDKISFNDNPQDESKVKSLKTVIALFQRGDKPMVHLKYRTKMSAPEFKVTSIGEGMLEQLKVLHSSTITDTITSLFESAQDKVGKGVKGIKGITIDPTVGAVKGFVEEFIKNIKKIIGQEDKQEKK